MRCLFPYRQETVYDWHSLFFHQKPWNEAWPLSKTPDHRQTVSDGKKDTVQIHLLDGTLTAAVTEIQAAEGVKNE